MSESGREGGEVSIRLMPAGIERRVPRGVPLQDILFAEGVEFPCGGRGRCRGCAVRIIEGSLPVTPEETSLLSPNQIQSGWRLACRHRTATDLQLELAQWEMSVLEDRTVIPSQRREGLGVAVDLGTTTLVGQLLDMKSGNVLAVRTALNEQARHGADLMSRIEHALDSGQAGLESTIRSQIGGLVRQLLKCLPEGNSPSRIVLVGNTAMHHLFCGVNVRCLAFHPFQPERTERITMTPQKLGWTGLPEGRVEFLPCIDGFVGSDVLGGVLAARIHETERLEALIDLGTNGEIVVGDRNRLVCASTAAGPAFEGARISSGMRASTGAVNEAHIENGALVCKVIGGREARGVCGSGLVDAVAAALDLEWVRPDGRLVVGERLQLAGEVSLNQTDIRELQLAKGAIAAGLRLLAARLGARVEDLTRIHLAGAFGNYISRLSAQRIGLLPLGPERVVAAGNTALIGAKRALFEDEGVWDALRGRIEHVSLNEDPDFHDVYVAEMRFPD